MKKFRSISVLIYSQARSITLFAAALGLLSILPLKAATDFWNGGGVPDGNWTTAANWGGTAPSALDLLDFGGSNQTLSTNNFAAATIFNNLSFDSTAASFLLSGNSFVLTNGTDAGGGNAAGGSITNFSANAQTNSIPITLSAGKHNISEIGTGKLYLSGAISRNAGAVVVFTNTGGGINAFGALSTNGQNNILGGWATIGNDWATLDNVSNVVAYTGYTALGSGPIANNAVSNVKLVSDTAAYTAANGTTINSILSQLTGANRTVTITGTLRLGSKGGIYRDAASSSNPTITGGNLVASGGGEITLSDAPFNGTANNLTVNSAITNDSGNAAVSVNILGYVAIGGQNLYTGGTYINQGRVQSTTTNGFGTGPVYVYPSGEAFLNGNGFYTNSFFISGIGTTETSGGQNLGAIRFGSAATNTGSIILMANARIAGASGGNNLISGKITGPGRLEFTAATGNNGGIQLANPASNNDWSGGMQITVGAGSRQVYVKQNVANQIPFGPGKGDVTLNCTSDVGRFDLNGFDATINGLISTASQSANNQVANYGPTAATLTIGASSDNATFGGVMDGGQFNLIKIGTGTQTLTGANTYNGTTLVEGGTLALSGVGSISGSSAITVSNAILDVSGQTTAFSLTPNTLALINSAALTMNVAAQPTIGTLAMTNSSIQTDIPLLPVTNIMVNTLDAGGTTNLFNITALPGITGYPQQFALIKYNSDAGNSATFVLGAMPSTYTGYISNDPVNTIIWLVATNGPLAKADVWNGNVNGSWDTATANWQGGLIYNQGDFVTFDDTLGGTPSVNLTKSLAPFTLTVSNSVANYTFNGPGKITGTTGLSKWGSGSLLLDNAAANDFNGIVDIEGGTVQVGNNDVGGGLGTGLLTNNAAIVFNRTDSYVNSNTITGTGSISQSGTGSATLSGLNVNYTGAITVSQGSLVAGALMALGSAPGGTTVNSGATLDVNGQILTNEPVTISGTGIGGAGAIVNNSATSQQNCLTNVTLAANATVGGNSRWDIRGVGDSLDLGNFTLTKTGTNQISIVSAAVSDGNIVINQGTLDIETATVSFGGNGTVTVNAGGSLGLFQNPVNSLTRAVTLNGGSIKNVGGTLASLDAPVTLTANSVLDPNGSNPGTVINSVIAESGGHFGLTKTNGNTFFLGGANTYSGATIVLGGTLALTNSGSIANSTLLSVGNATLDVSAEANNPFTLTTSIVTLASNALFNVSGNSQPAMGTLNATNCNLRFVLVNPMQPMIIVTNLNLVGTTNLVNLVSFSSVPTASQFPLIQYSTLTGPFNIGVSNLPVGYTGTLVNNSANKTIDLLLTASVATANWDGGDSAVDNYWTDPINWSGVALLQNNSLVFGGSAGLVNTNNTTAGNSYASINFNNGPYVLNGNPITLLSGGGITNNSGSLETVNLGINTSGTNLTLYGSSGGLTLNGAITNTTGASEFLTLFGTGTNDDFLATPAGGGFVFDSSDGSANWTIVDNGSSLPITITNGGILINGGSTLNFGTAGSAPNLTIANGWGTDNSVGNSSGTTTFNMVNGTLTLPVRLNTQGNPGGNVNVLGGTLNIAAQMQNANGSASDQSTVTVSGGTLNIGTVASPGSASWDLASRGTATLTVDGGLAECGTLDITRNAATPSVGTVNLNSGILQCTSVTTVRANAATNNVSGTTATFYFNGGTLRAGASSTNFYHGGTVATLPTGTPVPITSIVQAGGAIIDSSNFTISVLEPLQHDPNLGGTADGGLTKLGSGTLTLTAACTYTGNTVIDAGTLAVNGSIATGTVTVKNGATLAGTGSLGGNVTANVGGTVAPGGVGTVGTLTVTGNVTLQGTNAMDINHAAVTSDNLNAGGSIAYGGTLALTNLAGILSTNDTFKLFTAASYSGAFATLSPAIPAPGMGWNTNTLVTDGTLRLVATVNPNPTNITAVVSGNTLSLSWPSDHTGWTLQCQTNTLGSGLNPAGAWFDVPGSSSVSNVNITLDPAQPTVFYRMRL